MTPSSQMKNASWEEKKPSTTSTSVPPSKMNLHGPMLKSLGIRKSTSGRLIIADSDSDSNSTIDQCLEKDDEGLKKSCSTPLLMTTASSSSSSLAAAKMSSPTTTMVMDVGHGRGHVRKVSRGDRLVARLNSSNPNLFSTANNMQPKPIVLPERSLLSGKGSDKGGRFAFVRRMSERNLVKKISLSMHSNDRNHNDSLEESFFRSMTSFQDSFGGAEPTTGTPEEDGSSSLSFRRTDDLDESLANSFGPDAADSVCIPPLTRKELKVGEFVGQGSFSRVFAVDSIQLNEDDDTDDLSLSELCTEEELRARQDLSKQFGRGRKFVVKYIKRKLLRKPKEFKQAVLDMEKEAKILSLLDNDYIVQLRGIAKGGTAALSSGRFDDFFLIMDRLDTTLDQRIGEWKEQDVVVSDPQRIQSVLTFGHQLALALNHLHSHRLIFRDLKPNNVGLLKCAVTGTEKVQLFDFGLCRALPLSSSSGSDDQDECFHLSMAGTMRYMAPEVMDYEPEYNTKADVYSWAVTLYEMLALRKPYGEIIRHTQFQEIICGLGKRPFLGDLNLPAAIQELLNDSWCASISQRLTMQKVLDRLARIQQ